MTAPVRRPVRAWWTAVRRVSLAVVAVALAAMTWAAAHDIVRGEQEVTAEWTFVAFSVLLCGCALMGWLMRAGGRSR